MCQCEGRLRASVVASTVGEDDAAGQHQKRHRSQGQGIMQRAAAMAMLVVAVLTVSLSPVVGQDAESAVGGAHNYDVTPCETHADCNPEGWTQSNGTRRGVCVDVGEG